MAPASAGEKSIYMKIPEAENDDNFDARRLLVGLFRFSLGAGVGDG